MAKINPGKADTGGQWPARGGDKPPKPAGHGEGVQWPACGIEHMPSKGESEHPGQPGGTLRD